MVLFQWRNSTTDNACAPSEKEQISLGLGGGMVSLSTQLMLSNMTALRDDCQAKHLIG
jgi:hypothetical protein